MKFKMFESFLDYQEVTDAGDTFACLEGATFKKNFGSWKKDDKVDALIFTYRRGVVEECDSEGEVVKTADLEINCGEA